MAIPSFSINIAITTSSTSINAMESIKINEKTYYSAPPALALGPTTANFVGTAITAPLPDNASAPFLHHSWEAFTIVNSSSHVSLDQLSHT